MLSSIILTIVLFIGAIDFSLPGNHNAARIIGNDIDYDGEPLGPEGLAAQAGYLRVDLTWTPPNDNGSAITHYSVYRGTAPGGETLLEEIVLVTSYTDFAVSSGEEYYYVVTATNSNGEGQWSEEVSAIPYTVPTAPLLFQATVDVDEVDLSWSEPSYIGPGIIAYHIFRDGNPTEIWSGIATSYTDTNVLKGEKYSYTVSAENSAGYGPNTTAKQVTMPTEPDAPDLISATPGNNQVQLTWSAPGDDGGNSVYRYTVYRRTVVEPETRVAILGNVLTWTDNGVTNGVTYYYRISANNSVGESAKSNEVSSTPATAPSAPTNLVAIPGNAQVSLNWSAPADTGGAAIQGYNIYRSTTSGGVGVKVNSILITVLTYNDTGLANGVPYYYKVSAVNSADESQKSNEASAIPRTVPSAPNLISAVRGNGQVVLTWNAPASNGATITSYKIYRNTSTNTEVYLATVSAVLTYTDTNVTNGITYFYRVSAVNAAGEGTWSNERSATPATVPMAPNLTTATGGNSQVVLEWTEPSSGGAAITAYNVYRKNSTGVFVLIGTTSSGILSYIDSGLTNGVSYSYKVSAVNAVGESVQSNEASAIPMNVPSAPTITSAVGGDEQVVLEWSVPSYNGGTSITNYTIYRGTVSGALSVLITIGNFTNYTDSGLTNGVTYYYRVSATNAFGEGLMSAEVWSIPISVPSMIEFIEAVPDNSLVEVEWNSPDYAGPGALIYHLFRNGAEVYTGTGTNYTDTGLTNGQAYQYNVVASNSIGWGTNSTVVSATPQGPPSVPRNVIGEGGDGFVKISWDAPSYLGPGPVIYHVFRDSFFMWSGTTLVFDDTEVTNGETYSYKVVASNTLGYGLNSTAVLVTPTNDEGVPPGVPTDLEADVDGGAVVLTWKAPEDSGSAAITSYRIYRGTAPNATLIIAIVTSTSYTDSNVTTGLKYYYQVAAVSADGLSDLTAELSVTPGGSSDGGGDMTTMLLLIAGVLIVATVAVVGALWFLRGRDKGIWHMKKK